MSEHHYEFEFERLSWRVFDGSGPALAAFEAEAHALQFASGLPGTVSVVRFHGQALGSPVTRFRDGVVVFSSAPKDSEADHE